MYLDRLDCAAGLVRVVTDGGRRYTRLIREADGVACFRFYGRWCPVEDYVTAHTVRRSAAKSPSPSLERINHDLGLAYIAYRGRHYLGRIAVVDCALCFHFQSRWWPVGAYVTEHTVHVPVSRK